MFALFKNLLSGKVFERGALNLKLSKIKLGFPRKVVWLFILFFFLSFLGYYPVFTIPPVKRSIVLAESLQEKGEIISSSFSKPLVLPHPGFISTKFSLFHQGIDIASGLGMPIHSITDGKIEKTGFDLFGLGNYVVVSHENGFKSKYAHMGKIYVKKDQTVTSQNILGEVGLTGHTSGPHTHLEITYNGEFIDPQKVLPDLPSMPVVNSDKTQEASKSALSKR